MAQNRREVHSQVLNLTTDINTTDGVQFADFAGGTIGVPVGSPVTSLDIHGQLDVNGGEWFQAVTGLAVTAGQLTTLPSLVYGCVAVKFVANAAGQIVIGVKS